MSKKNNKLNHKSKTPTKNTSTKNTTSKIATTKNEKFDDTPSPVSSTTYNDIITFMSVSPTAGDNPVTFSDQLQDYCILVIKYGFLVILLTLNFLGLSVSLNCNADQELTTRIFSAIFAFFFGFVYLIINYYTYKVLGQGKICKMNRDKLFPFKT